MIGLGVVVGVYEIVAAVTELRLGFKTALEKYVMAERLALVLITVAAVGCLVAISLNPNVAYHALVIADLTIVVTSILEYMGTSTLTAGGEKKADNHYQR